MWKERTALVIVDMQKAMDDPKFGRRNQPQLVDNLRRTLGRWREMGLPVVFVADDDADPESPYHPGRPGNLFVEGLEPLVGEDVVRKRTSSAFVGTDLEERLRAAGIARLVVGGVHTNRCVESLVRSARDLGLEVCVLEDGTAAVGVTDRRGRKWAAADVHALALADMQASGAEVQTADALLHGLPG